MKRTALQGIINNLADSLARGPWQYLHETMREKGVRECRFDLIQPLEAKDEFQICLIPNLTQYQDWLKKEMENRKIKREELVSVQIVLTWKMGNISEIHDASVTVILADGQELRAKRGVTIMK